MQAFLFLWFLRVTHRVFVRVHGECELLEGLSDLSSCCVPADSQQTVVVLALCQKCRPKNNKEHQCLYMSKGMGPVNSEENSVSHHQTFQYNYQQNNGWKTQAQTSDLESVVRNVKTNPSAIHNLNT